MISMISSDRGKNGSPDKLANIDEELKMIEENIESEQDPEKITIYTQMKD